MPKIYEGDVHIINRNVLRNYEEKHIGIVGHSCKCPRVAESDRQRREIERQVYALSFLTQLFYIFLIIILCYHLVKGGYG